MRLEEQIMKLQTYKMFEGEDTVYVERDDVLKLLEQEPKTDTLDKIRAEIEEIEKNYGFDKATKYGNKNAEQQNLSYSTMHFYEIAYIFDDIKDIIDKYKTESEG